MVNFPAFSGSPDEGNVSDATGYVPYFGVGGAEVDSVAFFSPNRMNKKAMTTTSNLDASYRVGLNTEATLSQFDARFTEAAATGRIFLSPTELCDLWLVPETSGANATDAWMQAFWNSHRLTGDNLRERPYANLIPRLTTKSNTYTVHFRVQLLKPRQPNVWNEETDTVAAEFRGSTTIERFIDPNNADIPDYAAAADPGNGTGLDSFIDGG